jgi:hypothetical protein
MPTGLFQSCLMICLLSSDQTLSLQVALLKKAADSGINGRDGEVLKYRGKGGAHSHSGPLEPFPRWGSEHTVVASSFRGRADQAMRPATQLSLGRFRLCRGRVGNEFVQQRVAPPKRTSRTHNSSRVGDARGHRHLLQILQVFPGLGRCPE